MNEESNAVTAGRLLAASMTDSSGPKLSFVDRCSAYAALQMGIKQKVVLKAFGLSSAAVSMLANCGRNKARYGEVRREFERLGDRAFAEQYYSDEIHARVQRIKLDAEQIGDDRRLRGPSPNANKYAFDYYGPVVLKSGEIFRIDWIGAGWFFVDVPDIAGTWTPPSQGGTSRYRGEEINDETKPGELPGARRPFKTSSAAYNGLLLWVGER